MSISITVDGVAYDVPSSAADTNWAADQVAFEQALAAAVNEALATPVWVVLTPQNSWANVGGLAPSAYYVDPFSVVHLRFAVNAGTDGTVALALPAAARPPYPYVGSAIGAGVSDRVRIAIATNGNVQLNGCDGYDSTNGTYAEITFSTVANP